MNCSFDTIIAGAGLAGASAAFELSRRERVLIIDAWIRQAASRIPLGLFSPLMSRRARPVWNVEAAVDSLHRLLEMTSGSDLLLPAGLLKPARTREQAAEFEDASVRWPDHGSWYTAGHALEKWPGINAPFGMLDVLQGAAIPMGKWVDRLISKALEQGATHFTDTRVLGWDESDGEVRLRVDAPTKTRIYTAKRVILALGGGYRAFPRLTDLDLHPIKGQWIRAKLPSGAGTLPPVSAYGYCASVDGHAIIGSTYEHHFDHLNPTVEAGRQLLEDASQMIPCLRDAQIIDAGAAVRVTVPGIRLPMVGPLPHHKRTWILSGLGSKGLLLAPFLAASLRTWFDDPGTIPRELQVRLPRR